MINTLYGTKKGMTSGYDARGRRVGATILEVMPNVVAQVKTVKTDGYSAVQLGVGTRKLVKKPVQGHLKKNKIEASVRFLREVRVEPSAISSQQSASLEANLDGIESGQEVVLSQVFQKGAAVKVTGISKGRGFQGAVKRYNFAGGPKTHGQSDRHRAPGSIGSGTTPGRVLKGKRMAGHMGMDTVSYTNLEVIDIDRVNNLLFVKGGVPGPVGRLVRIENVGKIKGYTPPPEEKEDEEEPSDAKAMEGGEQSADRLPTTAEDESQKAEGENTSDSPAEEVKEGK